MTLTLPLYLDHDDYSIPSWLSDVLPEIDLLESPVAVQEGLLKNHPGGKRLDLLPRYPVHQPAKRLELIRPPGASYLLEDIIETVSHCKHYE